MVELIVPPIWCAIADRVRGGFPDDKFFGSAIEDEKPAWVDHVRHAIKFTYGMALVLPFTQTWWHILVAGVTWKFGEQIASDFGGTFRYVAGKDEWLLPLLQVGIMWPIATCAVLGYFCPPIFSLFITSMVACVLSAVIAKKLGYTPSVPASFLQLQTPGAWQEALRGFINGSLAAIIGANL